LFERIGNNHKIIESHSPIKNEEHGQRLNLNVNIRISPLKIGMNYLKP